MLRLLRGGVRKVFCEGFSCFWMCLVFIFGGISRVEGFCEGGCSGVFVLGEVGLCFIV